MHNGVSFGLRHSFLRLSLRTIRHSSFIIALVALLLAPSRGPAQIVAVQPYVQPGNGSTLTGSDVKVIAWLTDPTPGEFVVEFGVKGKETRTAQPARVSLDFKTPAPPPAKTPVPAEVAPDKKPQRPIPEKEQHYFKYAATLTGLPFDSEINYTVKLAGQVVRGGTFRTRATAGKPIRFVMVGDLARGSDSQNAVAYQMGRAQPQFVVALGDIVYPAGRLSQYLHHFWPTYNQPPIASPKTGAPLMMSVPIYAVMGNHDVENASLPNVPDAFAAYYFFHPPLKTAGIGSWNTPLGKNASVAAAFRAAAGTAYPALGIYSFDDGPGHFLALDSAAYVNYELPQLRDWIERDLTGTTARWKFVCFHCPMFQSARDHYPEQRMRRLAPLFEKCGVDIVFNGHVHNYQRSLPLRFQPGPPQRAPSTAVDGVFQIDRVFDGVTHTQPDGIIHIVSGGGGAQLHAGDLRKNADYFKKSLPGNWAPYTVKFVSDRNSFAVIDLAPERLLLRAIDTNGAEFDRMVITKPLKVAAAQAPRPDAGGEVGGGN
jgi:predicted phosphodiesterase